MEKLIELLNEYEKIKEKSEGVDIDTGLLREWGVKKRGFCNYDNIDRWEGDDYVGGVAIAYMIFKQYGFIKWLVDNDKIDKKKIDTRLVRNVESHYDEDGYWVENSYEDYSDTNTLLMLLSISDTPIADLVSYLK